LINGYIEAICRSQEKEKFDKMSMQLQLNLNELQQALENETQKVLRLQMELDAKESETEHLLSKLTLQGMETASVSSNNELDLDESFHGKLLRSFTDKCQLSVMYL